MSNIKHTMRYTHENQPKYNFKNKYIEEYNNFTKTFKKYKLYEIANLYTPNRINKKTKHKEFTVKYQYKFVDLNNNSEIIITEPELETAINTLKIIIHNNQKVMKIINENDNIHSTIAKAASKAASKPNKPLNVVLKSQPPPPPPRISPESLIPRSATQNSKSSSQLQENIIALTKKLKPVVSLNASDTSNEVISESNMPKLKSQVRAGILRQQYKKLSNEEYNKLVIKSKKHWGII